MRFEKRLAEGVGFEPTVPEGTPVFKTGAIVHSAIPPILDICEANDDPLLILDIFRA